MPHPPDVWRSGVAYEAYVGRWSSRVAREFVDWIGVPAGARWLDVGCGTGALTRAVLEAAAPLEVHGVDPSAGFLALARTQTPDPRARFETGDACRLPAADATCDAVVSGVINFVPEPAGAAAEMARVVRPGGRVALYVWDYADGMQPIRHFWDAAVELDPGARTLDEGLRFPVCRPEPLDELMRGAGLDDVETRAIDVPAAFRDFEDYWNPFLGGQGPAPTYAASLAPDRLSSLRQRLRERLRPTADGSIALNARAWAVRAVRPRRRASPERR